MSQPRCQEACFSGRGFGDCRRGLRANVLPRRAARMVTRPARRQRLTPMSAASDNASFKSAGSIIGIDLGTSNSAVAVVKDGTPEILPLEAGRSTIPSVIWLGKVSPTVLATFRHASFSLKVKHGNQPTQIVRKRQAAHCSGKEACGKVVASRPHARP